MRSRPISLVPFALVTVVVAVAVAGGSAMAGTSSPPDSGDHSGLDDADRDASIVCAELAAVPERLDEVEQIPGFDEPLLWRIQGVAMLAQAAGLGDPSHAEMGTAGETLLRALAVVEFDAFNEALAAMRAECDGTLTDTVTATADDAVTTAAADTVTSVDETTTGLADAALDAGSTCTLVDDVDEDFLILEMPGFDDPVLWRLQAISGFGEAAGRGDPAYAAMGEAASALYTSVQRFSQEDFDAAIGQLRDECTALPSTTEGHQ